MRTTCFLNSYWVDQGDELILQTPKEFNFRQILCFLKRTDHDPLHVVQAESVTKALRLKEGLVLLRISSDEQNQLHIEFLGRIPGDAEKATVAQHVCEWLDLDIDLRPFYQLAEVDQLLSKLIQCYAGLRVIGILDLFEVLAWAIMGQQINIQFAYMLQQSFVHSFGESITHDGQTFWLFPRPEVIAGLAVEDLKKLKFTGRKAGYIIGIAQSIISGEISREKLFQLGHLEEMEQELLKIRGVGGWTAHYVLMKCLRQNQAFPIQDVGVQNALKTLLDLAEKPTIEQIRELSVPWKGWERYVTFFLWRSLCSSSDES